MENRYLREMELSFRTQPNLYIKNDNMKNSNSEEPIIINDENDDNLNSEFCDFKQNDMNLCIERMMSMTDSYELISSEDYYCDRKYANLFARINTYPSNFKIGSGHDALQLSLYGFYWTGVTDYVRCFSCRITLYDFQENDMPLFEHIKVSKRCNYLHYVMGIKYFQKIQSYLQVKGQNSVSIATNKLENYLKNDKNPTNVLSPPTTSKSETRVSEKTSNNEINIDHIYADRQMRFLMESGMFTAENLLIYSILYQEELNLNTKSFFENLELEKFIDFTQDLKKDQPETKNEERLTPSAPPPTPRLSNNLCSCCMENDKNSVLFPCNHVCTCMECANYIFNKGNKKCPVCRVKITKVVKKIL